MALSAVLPVTWSPLLGVYFAITVILAMLDWTGLARAVRSKICQPARRRLLHWRPN